MNFSERIGLKPIRQVLQVHAMDEALRASLWNALHLRVWGVPEFMWSRYGGIGWIKSFSRQLWFEYYKRPIDEIPSHPNTILETIKRGFFGGRWNEVYDFLEAVLGILKNGTLEVDLNAVLNRELAGYRLIDGHFVEITDPQEIAALEEALSSDVYRPVSEHLARALQLLGDREQPDYRNSIKESISAVESMAKIVTKNDGATLGDALRVLEKNDEIHPALRNGMSNLYGYTNDADGIRHAMLEQPNLTAADAKYFLISCTAFVNYLKSKV